MLICLLSKTESVCRIPSVLILVNLRILYHFPHECFIAIPLSNNSVGMLF